MYWDGEQQCTRDTETEQGPPLVITDHQLLDQLQISRASFLFCWYLYPGPTVGIGKRPWGGSRTVSYSLWTACHSVLLCVTVCYCVFHVLQCVIVCYCVLQCVLLCDTVSYCVLLWTGWHSVLYSWTPDREQKDWLSLLLNSCPVPNYRMPFEFSMLHRIEIIVESFEEKNSKFLSSYCHHTHCPLNCGAVFHHRCYCH